MNMRFHLGGVSEYSVREMETPSSRTIPRIGPIEENNSEWEIWHRRKYGLSKEPASEGKGSMRPLLTREMAEVETERRQERRQERYNRRRTHVRMQYSGEKNPRSVACTRIGLCHVNFHKKVIRNQ